MKIGSKRLRFQKHGRRKFIIFIVAVCLVAAGVVGGIYESQHPGFLRDTFGSILPGATPVPVEPARIDASPTPVPTAVTIVSNETPPPAVSRSASPTADGDASRESDGTAFIGNSNLEDLDIYGLLPDADFFYRIGLTVDDALTETTATGTVPVVEEVNGKNYDKIFLMFGNNELGWDSMQRFLDGYAQVINKVREGDPTARIYVMGILPVTKAASDEGADGVSQERIDEYNEALKQLANNNDCYFLDLGLAMKDESGYLPDDAAEDGVHLNKDYSVKWADILRNEIGGEAG